MRSQQLKALRLQGFKNYRDSQFEFSPKLNCILGQNGMGKTNLLDAIYLLCLGKSNFVSRDRYLIGFEADFFRLQAQFERGEESEEIVVKAAKGKRKTFERNRLPYERLADHVGRYPLVIIAPDDNKLILEGSELRRRFMDLSLSQESPNYLHQLMQYNKLIKQRNALLKSVDYPAQPDPILLDSYDQQLLGPAQAIVSARKKFIEELQPVFQQVYAQLSKGQEEVSLRYSSPLLEQDFAELLRENRRKDIQFQRSTVGPHKDDLVFGMKGQTLKQFASQGQLKSYLLALKLAQYQALKDSSQKLPILLLDDIFDKLDAQRLGQLLELLMGPAFGQVFISDAHENRLLELLQKLPKAVDFKLFLIENGAIKEG